MTKNIKENLPVNKIFSLNIDMNELYEQENILNNTNVDCIIVNLDTFVDLDKLYLLIYDLNKVGIDRNKNNTDSIKNLMKFLIKNNIRNSIENAYISHDLSEIFRYESTIIKILDKCINKKILNYIINCYKNYKTRIYVCNEEHALHIDSIIRLLGVFIFTTYNIEFEFVYSPYNYNNSENKYIINTLKLSLKQSNGKQNKTVIILPQSEYPLNIITKKTILQILYV